MARFPFVNRTACLMCILSLPLHAQARNAPLSSVAGAYLRAALDTLETVTLGRDTIPWRAIRDSAFMLAAGARRPSDTFGAIEWALRRANKHSFLQATRPGAVAELIDSRYGYVHVPQRGGAGVSLADSLHRAVRMLKEAGACGWIVDLRDNGGGNMWPMLAGIGPLLGDSLVGQFGLGATADRWYYRDGVSGVMSSNHSVDTVTRVTVSPLEPVDSDAPVAVLIDGGTGSSGEALIVAFRGRPHSRTFGAPSAGFATVNRGSLLPDGTNMVVTTGYYVDRHGIQYAEQIQPDTTIPGPPAGWPFATDRVSSAATVWLAAQPACREHR